MSAPACGSNAGKAAFSIKTEFHLIMLLGIKWCFPLGVDVDCFAKRLEHFMRADAFCDDGLWSACLQDEVAEIIENAGKWVRAFFEERDGVGFLGTRILADQCDGNIGFLVVWHDSKGHIQRIVAFRLLPSELYFFLAGQCERGVEGDKGIGYDGGFNGISVLFLGE